MGIELMPQETVPSHGEADDGPMPRLAELPHDGGAQKRRRLNGKQSA